MANKTANLKTLKKWEEEFKTKFSYDLSGGKVSRIRCVICGKWEQRIKNCPLFLFPKLLRLCEIIKDTRFCLLILFPDLLSLRKSKNGGSIKQVFFI